MRSMCYACSRTNLWTIDVATQFVLSAQTFTVTLLSRIQNSAVATYRPVRSSWAPPPSVVVTGICYWSRSMQLEMITTTTDNCLTTYQRPIIPCHESCRGNESGWHQVVTWLLSKIESNWTLSLSKLSLTVCPIVFTPGGISKAVR